MPGRPNILWIVTTQWRAQALGCAGDANARTPSLDQFAAGSVNYTQAVTPHPFGPFARAALLTGCPSPGNGVRDYFDVLPAGASTIAHDLNERGYTTGFFGKWHLGERDPAAPLVGEAQARTIVPAHARGGFSFWEGFESGFLLNDPWLHGTRLPGPQRFEGYQSGILCHRAAEWLRDQSEPWFAVISLEAPHPPYLAPADGIAPADPREIMLPPNVPRGGEAEARARRELAGYYAHIMATDRAIGRLLAGPVVSPPEGRPPIVVFTSVHGDMHGAHGYFRKGWPYEESIRVPLLVRGADAGPRRDSEPASLLDLRRWTAAWADGTPVTARSRVAAISMPSVVALPDQCDRTWRGVRTSTRKLVLQADGSPWLFFNLESDPFELNNRAADPDCRTELKSWRALID